MFLKEKPSKICYLLAEPVLCRNPGNARAENSAAAAPEDKPVNMYY
jgi:hypothetical protein